MGQVDGFASFLSGYAADRFGSRSVLIALALLGGLCSLSIGWLADLTVPLLLCAVAIYGFATIGDSSVLSAAMADAVPMAAATARLSTEVCLMVMGTAPLVERLGSCGPAGDRAGR